MIFFQQESGDLQFFFILNNTCPKVFRHQCRGIEKYNIYDLNDSRTLNGVSSIFFSIMRLKFERRKKKIPGGVIIIIFENIPFPLSFINTTPSFYRIFSLQFRWATGRLGNDPDSKTTTRISDVLDFQSDRVLAGLTKMRPVYVYTILLQIYAKQRPI